MIEPQPDPGAAHQYRMTSPDDVPIETRQAVQNLLVLGAADLGIEPPAIRWYRPLRGEADARTFGVPASVMGFVLHGDPRTIWLRTGSVERVMPTALHELRHLAQLQHPEPLLGPGDGSGDDELTRLEAVVRAVSSRIDPEADAEAYAHGWRIATLIAAIAPTDIKEDPTMTAPTTSDPATITDAVIEELARRKREDDQLAIRRPREYIAKQLAEHAARVEAAKPEAVRKADRWTPEEQEARDAADAELERARAARSSAIAEHVRVQSAAWASANKWVQRDGSSTMQVAWGPSAAESAAIGAIADAERAETRALIDRGRVYALTGYTRSQRVAQAHRVAQS